MNVEKIKFTIGSTHLSYYSDNTNMRYILSVICYVV